MRTTLVVAPALLAGCLLLIAFAPASAAAPSVTASSNPQLYHDYSYNWAGYYVSGNGFTEASASWTVPEVANTSSGYSAAWVGIGGVNGNGLVQIGTEQDCLSSGTTAGASHGPQLMAPPPGGHPGHGGGGTTPCTPPNNAWWETYPANAEQPISGLTISPGDVMDASVQLGTSGTWTLTISDTTTGAHFTQTATFTADQTTAEAIMERPALCRVSCKLTDLADFGTIPFTSAHATSSSGGYFDVLAATAITMVDSGLKTLAYPGGLSSPGTFTVTWVRNR